MTNVGCDLRGFLVRLFGDDDHFIRGASIREQGKTFSIAAQGNEQVVGIRVDGGLIQDENIIKCDAIFFICKPGMDRFLIALVELKGADTKQAVPQLMATRDYLHKMLGCNSAEHRRNNSFVPQSGRYIPSHGGTLLGVIVSPHPLPNIGRAKAKARQKNIKLVKATRATGLSCSSIYSWADSKG